MGTAVKKGEKPNAGITPNKEQKGESPLELLMYLIIGVGFGIIFIKAEIVSWFRIQEMFRLQSFFMYGVIGSAIVVGALSIQVIKWLNIKTIKGDKIIITDKEFRKGQIIGGFIFGLGWALTGACPGPLFAWWAGQHAGRGYPHSSVATS